MLAPAFIAWVDAQRNWADGDLCVVNSSFMLRDTLKTNQSPLRLVLVRAGPAFRLAGVADFRSNGPFKRLSHASTNLPDIVEIEAALAEQQGNHGDLMFALIGDVGERAAAHVEETIGAAIKSVVLDTSLDAAARISEDTLYVRRTDSADAVWAAVGQRLTPDLRSRLAAVMDQLDDSATIPVVVPPSGTRAVRPFLHFMTAPLSEAVDSYERFLNQWLESQDDNAMHEVLRIAYSFASDAMRLLTLVLSICDLKPSLFWLTVDKQLELEQAFSALPLQAAEKASVKAYKEIVNTARNHAFHNSFDVAGGIKISLAGASQAKLEEFAVYMFGRHGSKANRNRVSFKDQQIVELLTEFTRASWRAAPDGFWEKNLVAMRAVVALLNAAADALVELRAQQS